MFVHEVVDSIEATSKYANVHKISDVCCETASVGVNDSHLDSRAKQLAKDCYEEKKALLGAETKEQGQRQLTTQADIPMQYMQLSSRCNEL